MHVLTSFIVAVILVGEFSQAVWFHRKEGLPVSSYYKEIDKWLTKQGVSIEPTQALAEAAEHLALAGFKMKNDQIQAWRQFTALGEITPEDRCKRSTTDLLLANARESGFKWYEPAGQKLTIQKIIEKLAVVNAEECQSYFNKEIKLRVESLKGFNLIWDLTFKFMEAYNFKPTVIAPDRKDFVSFFEGISKPARQDKTSSIIENVLAHNPSGMNLNSLITRGPYAKNYNAAKVKEAVDHIFSICFDFTIDEAVEQLIIPFEAYAKFHYYKIQPYHKKIRSFAWFCYKFCNNFSHRDRDKIINDLTDSLA